MERYWIKYDTGNYLVDVNDTPYLTKNGYTEVDKATYDEYAKEKSGKLKEKFEAKFAKINK